MKKIILIMLLMAFTFILQAEEIGNIIQFEIGVDSLAQKENENNCNIRGHYAIKYIIYKENVLPMTIDYADSTILYYYEDNVQTGTILRCKRCGEWLSVQMEKPIKKILWEKE